VTELHRPWTPDTCLIRAWARSRSGFNNRLTAYRMTADLDRPLGQDVLVVDGDAVDDCRTIDNDGIRLDTADHVWIDHTRIGRGRGLSGGRYGADVRPPSELDTSGGIGDR
jgi:hypothetical protein